MKKIICIIIIILSFLQAKTQDIRTFSAANGVFIQISNSNQAFETFELQRSQKNRFKTIAKLTPPETEADFIRRYQLFKDLFPLKLRNESESLTMIWYFINNRKPLEKHSAFRHPAVQVAMGVAWLDQKVENDQTYHYQLLNSATRLPIMKTIQFHPHQFTHESFKTLSSTRNEDFPSVEWWSSFADGIVDYEVFRREIGEREFEEIFPLRQKAQSPDSMRLMMTDTTVVAEGIYEYYIIPLDLLGNRGARSQYAQAGNFSTKTLPTIFNLQVENLSGERSLKLSWRLKNKERVRSLQLFRSREPRRGFVQIRELAVMDSLFTDPIDEPGEGYYYYLKINDITGKLYQSITVFGIYSGNHIAPTPVRLMAEAERNRIQLNWQGRGDNIRGYYVFRANGYKGELKQISPFISVESGSSFVDTAKLSGNGVYSYAVKSESKSYELGEFSERVIIRPNVPTTISAPLSIQSQYQDDQVRISWENLAARKAQLEGYFLFRREINSGEFQQITHELISFSQNYFYDRETKPGKTYQYSVQSIDAFGAKSSLSKTTEIQIPLPNLPERLMLKRQLEGIELDWNAPISRFTYQTEIYRVTESGDRILLKKGNSRQKKLLDDTVKKGEFYTYYLVCVDANGNTLKTSDPISIRY